MQVTKLNDRELIVSYLDDNNDKAFEDLLKRHKDKIYTSIYLFVKNKAQAEDIFQDVFIKIIDTLRKGKYNHEGKFVQWAMRISYNMCVDNFRKKKRRPTVAPTDDFDIFDILHTTEPSAETKIIQSQTHQKIRSLVDQLPDEQREVVILRHYADMSFKEISQLTQVSINTALGRMRYALINLRKLVEERQVSLR